MDRLKWSVSVVGVLALMATIIPGGAIAAGLDVQGALTAEKLVLIDSGSDRTLDFGRGNSSFFDNGDLHVKTDDLLYLDALTTSVSGRLDVSKDLYAHYPIYAKGNLIQFGGNKTSTLDFGRGSSRIYDNGNLTLSTDDNLIVAAPTLNANRDLHVARNGRFDGAVSLTQIGGSATAPSLDVKGYALFDGTVDFSSATTIGLASGSSSTADFTVGTDLTVTSGARIGTGSTPDDITALADDTLFVEGASEFDGALYVDGAVDLDSTVNVAGASTLTGAVTSATNVTANLGGAEKFTISADSAPTDDMLTVTNAGFARTGASGSAIQVNFVQGEITGTDTHSAVLISTSTTSTDDTLYGLEIDSMSGTAGTQAAFLIDSGWDTDINLFDNSPVIALTGTTPTLTFNDGTNTLMTLTDAGTTGNLTVTGTSTVSGSADGTDALIVTAGDILVSNGDLDLSGGDFNVVLDAADTASIANSAATADSLLVTNTGVGSDGITVALTQSDDADATDQSVGLRVAGTSSSGDADEFYGIDIANLTGGTALETALHFGTGWDEEILFEDTSPFITMANTGILKFRDDAGNVLFTIRDDGTTGAIYGDTAGTGKLGLNTSEWSEIYLGDNAGLNLGLDTDALFAYDNATDGRTELTGTGASLWIEDRLSLGTQALTITDDGVANDSVTPTASVVVATVDATANVGTPNLTIAEASAKAGDMLIVISATGSGDSFTINDEATVTNGTAASLGADDTATFIYTGTIWTQLATSNN